MVSQDILMTDQLQLLSAEFTIGGIDFCPMVS